MKEGSESEEKVQRILYSASEVCLYGQGWGGAERREESGCN